MHLAGVEQMDNLVYDSQTMTPRKIDLTQIKFLITDC